ncbi:hypothetical protein [Beijerinckia mobilis]|uniref:hypothetical protein n=1 Tax=Beijerinckia mobilis TaxID=231434 RepID=UPI00054F5C9B|nr:hypothetical protein [Beijerinckia mobilis]
MDFSLLLSTMIAGASTFSPTLGEIIGTEVIKELTKDAYKSLKGALITVCGRKVERAANRLEVDASSQDAQAELASAIADIPPEDAGEISQKLTTLLTALKDDQAAIKAAESIASIKVDIDSGGHVKIDTIKGAQTIDVKSKSAGDFSLTNIDMRNGKPSGN